MERKIQVASTTPLSLKLFDHIGRVLCGRLDSVSTHGVVAESDDRRIHRHRCSRRVYGAFAGVRDVGVTVPAEHHADDFVLCLGLAGLGVHVCPDVGVLHTPTYFAQQLGALSFLAPDVESARGVWQARKFILLNNKAGQPLSKKCAPLFLSCGRLA